MSNERPIEPSRSGDQSNPEGGDGSLDLGGEQARRRGETSEPAVPCEAEEAGREPAPGDSWLLDGDEPELPHEDRARGLGVGEHSGVTPAAGTGNEPWLLQLEDEAAGAPGTGIVTGEIEPITPLQPLALDTTYCEPEPTSRTVSRAARTGLLVMGGVIVAIAGVQITLQGARTSISVDPPKAVELERSIRSETILSGPDPVRVAVESVSRGRFGPSVQTKIRPAQLDELTVWDDRVGDDETADPFELDVPAAATPWIAPRLALANRWENVVELELELLKAAARDLPAPLPAPTGLMRDELQVHAPELAPLELLAGPSLAHCWMLLHPVLTPRREGPAPAWVGATDPLPVEVERHEEYLADWTVAEAVEKPAMSAAPGPLARPSRGDLVAEEAMPPAHGEVYASVPLFGAAAAIAVEVLPDPAPLLQPGSMARPARPMAAVGPPVASAPPGRPAVPLPWFGRTPFEYQVCQGGCGAWCDLDEHGAWFLGDPVGDPIYPTWDFDQTGRWNLGYPVAPVSTSAEAGVPVSDLDGNGCWALGHPSGSLASSADPEPVTDRVVLEPVRLSGEGSDDLVPSAPISGPSAGPVTTSAVSGPVPDPPGGDASRSLTWTLDGGRNLLAVAVAYLRAGELPSLLQAGPAPFAARLEESLSVSQQAPSLGEPGAAAVTEDTTRTGGDPQRIIADGVPAPEQFTRAGALVRAPSVGRWGAIDVPGGELIGGPRRVLTPNVGEVLVSMEGGGKLTGTLHAVGHGKVWLTTTTGRMSLEARRVISLQYAGRGSSTAERVCVTTLGGVFVGTLLAREGERVTLRTDEGLTLTLTSGDVRPESDQRKGTGLRRRSE